jgi:mannose-6-phosphate isomerase
MYRIKGIFQHYEWGGNTYLPGIFNLENPIKKPFAEYWLGVHSGGVSTVELDQGSYARLDSLINSHKKHYLGESTYCQFGNLPFLLKILDVKKMLSIQVHPTKSDAEAGFARENQLGIPLNAPFRNYKDDNHKPEIMVALSDFWLLHGFAMNIEQRLSQYDILNDFIPSFVEGGIKGLYEAIMNLSQDEVNRKLSSRMALVKKDYLAGVITKISPDYWAARACMDFNIEKDYDRGIFSIYLFNIVNLKPGQGIYQGAGMPHAYMEGQNIELMSNSDNVLRGGLTPKHIDVNELMKNILFEKTTPQIIDGSLDELVCKYSAPVDDFNLTYFLLEQGNETKLSFDKPSIALLIEGQVNWHTTEKDIDSVSVDSIFVKPSEVINVYACSTSRVFIASVN